MNFLVIGCGKVGAKLASVLDKIGHDVCIVDRSADAFERIDNDFTGYTVAGIPIDQMVLRRAGIESADAVIAVTQDDNVNIMVSQLAKEVYHVKNVLTRIYDPTRENVYAHFDLTTICPTNMTVDAVCAILENELDMKELSFGVSTVGYSTVPAEKRQIGLQLSEIDAEDSMFFAVRSSDGRLTLANDTDYTVRDGDRLIFAHLI